MKRLFLFILLFTHNLAFGQDNIAPDGDRDYLKYTVQKKIDSLKTLGVDSIINYYSYFMDLPIPIIDSLGRSYEIQYLLWKQKPYTYAQKFVRYDDSHTIIKSLRICNEQNIFTFLKVNYHTIRVEEILPFITKYFSRDLFYCPLNDASVTNVKVYVKVLLKI